MPGFGWIEGDNKMSEQGTIKVYELAKELGIDSISLLDKLKNLNINVKNHMSELGTQEVQLARSSLRKGAHGDSGKTSGTKRAPAKVKKKLTETSAQASSDALAQEKKAASPIIRRRIKTEGVQEASTLVKPPSEASRGTGTDLEDHLASGSSANAGLTSESEFQDFSQQEHAAVSDETSEQESLSAESLEIPEAGENIVDSYLEATEAASPTEPLSPPSKAAQESKPRGTSKPTLTLSSATTPSQRAPSMSPSTESLGKPTKAAPPQVPAGASVTPPAAALTPPPTKAPRAPVVLTPRPVAPRRSILKIVEASAPPPRPIIKPAPIIAKSQQPKPPSSPQDKEGFRIIKMSKENLDQMVEEEAAKKRGGVREQEIRPEDVRFADYRKKELVFLPKKKKIPIGKEIKQTQKTVAKAQKRIVNMQDTITVQDLANQLSVKTNDVIRKLMSLGHMATINQSLDFDTATLLGGEYQYEVRNVAFHEDEMIESTEDAAELLKPRPPIVTIMGHVDHGKTTLLDSIREANVAGGEAGGITQHIGAYTVEKNGKLITFIDTPGHEAFSVMRARGANVTDIVILVVSADDGVMPQTREALSHAQAAKVPIIVAVNKIDKAGANPEKIKQGLAELNLLSEDWGGETMFIPVSALKKTNIDKLLDAILLQSEILDLKANPDTRASGTVLEARLEKGRGPVVSLLVRRGTLRVGDAIVTGPYSGKVKAMADDQGRAVKIAQPGYAVEVHGLDGVPNAGEAFNATESEGDARHVAEFRQLKTKAKISGQQGKLSLDELFSKIQAGDVKELNVILKADAYGSVEAIRESLGKVATEKVKVKVILSAPGGITESDVLLASASNAIIIGFNVRPETKARQLAEAEHVEVKCYTIIYELLDDVKKAMTGMLDKKKVEKFLGRAEVRQTFTVPKIGTIAGSSVIDGKIIRGASVRLLRDNRTVYEGKMSSLRRFKDDAKEVTTGFECGIGIENYNDIKPGDVIEAFQIELITPELNA